MSIDDNGRNLLVHENENGGEHGRSDSSRNSPPGVSERMDQPSASAPRRFEFVGYDQLGCGNAGESVHWSHRADGQEDTEVTDYHPHLVREEVGRLEVLQYHAEEVSRSAQDDR